MSSLIPWSLLLINSAVIILSIIHCWKRNNIYQPFQLPGTAIRLFWTVLLVTFSPVAWCTYLLFGLFITNHKNRTNVFHTMYSLLLIPCCILVAIEKFPQTKPLLYPATINLHEAGTPEDSQNHLSYYSGSSDIKTNTSSSSSTQSTNHSLFSFRRLAFIIEDDHPIITETVPLLIGILKETSYVDEIIILNSIDEFPDHATLPDYWMHLQLVNLEESGFNVYKSIQSVVRLNFTLHPFNATMRFYHDELHSPTSIIEANIKADVNAKVSAFGTGNTVYKDVCKDIAKNLSEPLIKQMNEMVSKYGLFPDIEDKLLSHTAEEEQPYKLFNPELPVVYGKRPLIHSIAYQTIPSITPIHAYLEQSKSQLEQDGWEINRFQTDGHQPNVRAQKDQWKVIVYGEKPKRHHQVGIPAEKYETMPMDVFIEYMHVLSDEELNEKYRSLLSSDSPAELLLYFQNTFRDHSFREEFYQILHQKSTKNPSVMFELAKQEKNTAIKHKQLYQAYFKNKMISDPKNQNNQIEKEIKILEEKHPNSAQQINWNDLCQTLGAKPIVEGKPNRFTAQVGYNEPAAFYFIENESKPHFLAATVIANHEYQDQAGLRIVDTHSGSSSWGSSHENRFHTKTANGQSIIFSAQLEVINPNQFTLTITLEPNSSTTQ